MNPAASSLTRALHPMPGFVEDALELRGLMAAYQARPPYQRNDYLGWILRAKTDDAQLRRLEQMLAELEHGALYMKMRWRPRAPAAKKKR
ncbi:YdeI/OmpD-associated family protein [Eleftheria terrae]|uniref:YdeI/OmpD-associated family protein n=1 Tax=Eleftheria terrae TaxID=1597781 RepID=UPI00263A585E|nr:YdeI/OmpD-associated family protein [Eleftheria terrae]WKB52814.1 YdeI/OmpD-associated family protein [Eleftheria terrae]